MASYTLSAPKHAKFLTRFKTMDAAEIMNGTTNVVSNIALTGDENMLEVFSRYGFRMKTPDEMQQFLTFLDVTRETAEHSPTFDFGKEMDYNNRFGEQAEELMEEDVFTLPFKSVYARSIIPHNGLLMSALFFENLDNPHGPPSMVTFSVMRMHGVYPDIYIPGCVIRLEPTGNRTYKRVGVVYHKAYMEEDAVDNLETMYWHFCSAFTSLTSARSKVEVYTPTERHNAKRIERGQVPQVPRYTVRLQHFDTDTRSRSLEEGKDREKRKTPCPHWRRAHLRHYADGTVTPIEEMFVAGKPGDVSEIGKKMYAVIKERLRAKKKAA